MPLPPPPLLLLLRSAYNSISASCFPHPFHLCPTTRLRFRSRFFCTMKPSATTTAAADASNSPIPADPKVNTLQQVLHSDPYHPNPWDKCWDIGLTPWDLGAPTPVLVHLNNIGSLPKGRALIPGCGSGYDVVTIACAERHVVGLDISANAIKKAAELSSGSPNAFNFTFLEEDFFMWRPSELFDLIFDYTFFCAIEPELRPLWARRIHDLLKPDGELITLMFPIDDHEGGPPYSVSVADYEEVLHGVGIKAIHIADNELAVASRKGRERIGTWKRGTCHCQSTL